MKECTPQIGTSDFQASLAKGLLGSLGSCQDGTIGAAGFVESPAAETMGRLLGMLPADKFLEVPLLRILMFWASFK